MDAENAGYEVRHIRAPLADGSRGRSGSGGQRSNLSATGVRAPLEKVTRKLNFYLAICAVFRTFVIRARFSRQSRAPIPTHLFTSGFVSSRHRDHCSRHCLVSYGRRQLASSTPPPLYTPVIMNKVLIFGRIHYKNKRSVTLAKEAFIRFAEQIAKSDMMYKPEAVFGEDLTEDFSQLVLDFPRERFEAADKTVRHTLQSFETLLDYAIAGQIDMFVIAANELPVQETRRVVSEKTPSMTYMSGLEALEAQDFQEAVDGFTESLEAYKDNPWAYNGRGLAAFELGQIDQAEKDFKKAAKMYPAFPSPHLGLAKIYHQRGKMSAAVDACEQAMNGSIPHQPGYWISALFSANVLLEHIENNLDSLSSDQIELYAKKCQGFLTRYEQKLRQLGSQRSDYYPTAEQHQALQTRLDQISETA